MDLGKHPEGKKSSGQGDYENGNIYSILYEKNNLPDDEKLVADLIKFMKMYNYLLSERGNELFSEDEINNITNSDEYLDNTNKIDNFNSKYMAYQRNKIFFGAPGTGKSYELNKQKGKLLDEYSENYERVTFHPDYSYANFVGTYKPIPKGDNDISYDFVEGPFLRILTKALKKPSEPFLLIIEEINRANVAAVFGDIFQLLDRDKNYCSEYPINISEDMKRYFKKVKVTKKELPDERLFIPHNMFIWATMNSADQGVFFMDTAFKRRWEFTHININNNEEKIKDKYYKLNEENINWNNLRKSINSYLLDENINEDKCLGPFFISDIVKYGSITPQDFMDSFKNKVLMYLFEDAGKSKRDSLFEGSKKDNEDFTYSKICEDFDKNGINIFHSKIIKEYKSMIGQDDK